MRAPTPLTPADPSRVGPFHLLGRLAAGGMGEVYLGREDDRPDSLVVVKLVRADLAHDRLFRERFRAEVAAMRHLASLESTFVPRLVGADVDAARPWLASEFVPGPSVAEAASGGGLGHDDVERVAASLAEALSALHSHGLVHGDVTPANVVLGPDGVRLIDLGLVRTQDEPVAPGARLGSPGWCAPEVMSGRPASTASDVHGWGCTVAYAATASSPFGDGTPEVLHQRMRSGTAHLDRLPRSLRPVVDQSLAPEPLLRPTSAELHLALARVREPVLVGAATGATAPLAGSAITTEALIPPTAVDLEPMLPWDDAGATAALPERHDEGRDEGRDRRALAAVGAVLAGVLLVGAVWALAAPDDTAPADSATVSSPTSSPTGAATRAGKPSASAPAPRAVPAAAPVDTSRTTGAGPDKAGPREKGKAKGKDKGQGKGRGKG